jgi:Ca-activated chloride channel family protein
MINHFAHPEALWLLLVIPVYAWRELRRKQPAFLHSQTSKLLRTFAKKYQWLGFVGLGLRSLALLFLIIALAQPQTLNQNNPEYASGVDIMIALDASGSMAAEDLRPNRIEAAKSIMQGFVQARAHDRIGLVVFGVGAATKSPLTFDKSLLVNVIGRVRLGELGDGTAIGQALVTAVNRLQASPAQSRIVVLVTDGENNAGSIGPLEAAQLAADVGIKIYTVGIGTAEGTPMIIYDPVYGKQYARTPDGQPVLTKLNVTDLVALADKTGGRFYQARTTAELQTIFQAIDSLEKTKLQSDVHYIVDEHFMGWIILGVLFVFLELFFSAYIVRSSYE